MIVKLGTYSIPAIGTQAPTIPSLVFDGVVVGALNATLTGPGASDFGGISFTPAVNVATDGLGYFSAATGANGFDPNSLQGGAHVTFVPVENLQFSFNQSANAYIADLELHLVGDARISEIEV